LASPVRFVCHIAGDRVSARDLLGERSESLGTPGGQDGNPAGLANRSGELSAQPGAGPCDDDDAIL